MFHNNNICGRATNASCHVISILSFDAVFLSSSKESQKIRNLNLNMKHVYDESAFQAKCNKGKNHKKTFLWTLCLHLV